MQSGQLHWRLPTFKINEWQQTGLAINQLASSQQLLLDQQRRLSVQLMTLQEDERRFLSRELHDEIGQCLTAINAITTAIAQTADQQYPELTADLLSIRRITQHMQQAVHDLLSRLRPAEMEELGLAASLESLIRSWQNQKPASTDYQLTISGDYRKLSTTQAMALFRIAQECLTNINRHAQASQVTIELSIAANSACLQVMDDGLANSLPFANQTGLGLLGIRERLTALQGTLQLNITEPHGLTVKAWLPLAQTTTPA
jgi:signal transduction histidine kinase